MDVIYKGSELAFRGPTLAELADPNQSDDSDDVLTLLSVEDSIATIQSSYASSDESTFRSAILTLSALIVSGHPLIHPFSIRL
jgi:hypothetical protein